MYHSVCRFLILRVGEEKVLQKLSPKQTRKFPAMLSRSKSLA
jgi:hypothetical protein